MTAGSNVPAAIGIVKVKTDKDNGNTELDNKVDHLAHPASLNRPANAYLVCVRPSGGAAVKLGAIRVNNDLNGQVNVVTVT